MMTRREAFGNCGLLGMLAALWPWGSKPRAPKHDFAKVARDAMAAYRVRGYPLWARVRYHVGDAALEASHGRVGQRCEAKDGVALLLSSVKGERLNGAGGWCLTYTFRREVWLDRFGNLIDANGGILIPPRLREMLFRRCNLGPPRRADTIYVRRV